jgi:hypothetical protein
VRKLSLTDALAALAAVAGLVAAGGFAVSNTALGGAALGVAATLLAVLVHAGLRSLSNAQRESMVTLAKAQKKSAAGLAADVQVLADKTDLVVRGNRKVVRQAAKQADRVEAQVSAHMRRVIADVSTFRLEVADSTRPSVSANQAS